jgi:NAD(P)-dependent dehydrogenase (short-subunit alcohol dehydrogenase family)
MAGRLENKVAIVTGATSGIGRAVAALFVTEGAKVVIAGRSEQSGLELERELRASGGDAIFVRTDVTKTEDLQYLVSVTIERYGHIDVLVNNAGTAASSALAEFDELRIMRSFSTSMSRVYLVLCREVLRI